MKPRLFTGIQPTGNLHLGNYFGAIKNALPIQQDYDGLFCIVDLHSLTVPQDPGILKKNILEVTREYLASGIDPDQSTLFVQSQVKEHTELCWVLATLAKNSELERMTQFKEKSQKNKQNINLGLFSYPVLMAADILLYNTKIVPVGEDQKQHLELARTLAQRFNNKYGKTFVVPEALIKNKEEGCRIMGLDDPTVKMSKSASSPANYILLAENPTVAEKKIQKATTDSDSLIKMDPARPGIANLLTIYSLTANLPIGEIEVKYSGKGYGQFKKDLGEQIKKFLEKHQERASKITDQEIKAILRKGAEKASKIAQVTMAKVKKKIGLL